MMEIRKTRAQMHADAHVASKSVKPTYVDTVAAQPKATKRPAPAAKAVAKEETTEVKKEEE